MKWGLSNTEFQYKEFFNIQFIFDSFIQYLGELTLERNKDTIFHLTGSPPFPISSSGLNKLSSILSTKNYWFIWSVKNGSMIYPVFLVLLTDDELYSIYIFI